MLQRNWQALPANLPTRKLQASNQSSTPARVFKDIFVIREVATNQFYTKGVQTKRFELVASRRLPVLTEFWRLYRRHLSESPSTRYDSSAKRLWTVRAWA